MAHIKTPYPVESGWLFGLKWSTVGVFASVAMLAGCSFFDVDENKERHNKVYGERKAPKLNPQAPRATKQVENAARSVNAALDNAPASNELTPFDQYHSQAAVDAAPPPTAPQADSFDRIMASPSFEASEPETLMPLPAVTHSARQMPKENKEILGVQGAPVIAAPVITYEPPIIRDAEPFDTMPMKEVAPIASVEMAPAYTPPVPMYQYEAPSAPIASNSASSSGSLGTLNYNAQTDTVAAMPTPSQPTYAYQPPQQAYLPITRTARAPTPVGPLVLNSPEEALQTEQYLRQSRYATRRNMNRRVNAY